MASVGANITTSEDTQHEFEVASRKVNGKYRRGKRQKTEMKQSTSCRRLPSFRATAGGPLLASDAAVRRFSPVRRRSNSRQLPKLSERPHGMRRASCGEACSSRGVRSRRRHAVSPACRGAMLSSRRNLPRGARAMREPRRRRSDRKTLEKRTKKPYVPLCSGTQTCLGLAKFQFFSFVFATFRSRVFSPPEGCYASEEDGSGYETVQI